MIKILLFHLIQNKIWVLSLLFLFELYLNAFIAITFFFKKKFIRT